MGNITHNKSTILVELISKEETALFHTVSKTGRGRQGPTGSLLFVFSTCNIFSSLSMSGHNKYSVEPITFQYLPRAVITHFWKVVGTSCSQCWGFKLSFDSRVWVPPPALYVVDHIVGHALD